MARSHWRRSRHRRQQIVAIDFVSPAAAAAAAAAHKVDKSRRRLCVASLASTGDKKLTATFWRLWLRRQCERDIKFKKNTHSELER